MKNDDYDYLKASSAQDCTGLIPAGIQYEEELENYRKRFGKRKKKELPKVVIDGKTYTDVTSLIVDCGEA